MFSTTYRVLLHANLNVSELKGRLLGIFFRIIKMNVTEQYRFFFFFDVERFKVNLPAESISDKSC